MTIKEQIAKIKKYQCAGMFHPLTCGNDSNHKVLEPIERDGRVILICKDCDYIQTWYPSCVLDMADDIEKSEFHSIIAKMSSQD